jgi:hypothetical protein
MVYPVAHQFLCEVVSEPDSRFHPENKNDQITLLFLYRRHLVTSEDWANYHNIEIGIRRYEIEPSVRSLLNTENLYGRFCIIERQDTVRASDKDNIRQTRLQYVLENVKQSVYERMKNLKIRPKPVEERPEHSSVLEVILERQGFQEYGENLVERNRSSIAQKETCNGSRSVVLGIQLGGRRVRRDNEKWA